MGNSKLTHIISTGTTNTTQINEEHETLKQKWNNISQMMR